MKVARFSLRMMIPVALGLLQGCVNIASLPSPVDVESKDRIVIADVTVFDGFADHPVLQHQDVFIESGLIHAIRPHHTDYEGWYTIDGKGKTLLPGLIDFHVHLGGTEAPPWHPVFYSPEHTLASFLAFGVTSVVDMGGVPYLSKDLKEKVVSGDIVGPKITYAGKQLTVDDSHPGPLIDSALAWPLSALLKSLAIDEVSEETDFNQLMADKKANGVSLVKIMIDHIPLTSPAMTLSIAQRVVEAAHREGLPVAAHIGSEQDLLIALDAGVDIIAHSVNQSELSESTRRRLLASNVVQVSTLRVFDNIARVQKGDNPVTHLDEKVMAKDVVAAYSQPGEVDGDMAEYSQKIAQFNRVMFHGCRQLADGGAQLLMGTDSPLFGSPAGSSAHAELQLLVHECGYTPVQALELATRLPGELLSKWNGGAKVGVVQEGASADLLLVEGQPFDAIEALQQVKYVISGKQLIRPVFE